MMTFYHIRNIDRFFQIIDACAGGVFFKADDGTYIDIRNNGLVRNLLVSSGGRHGIEKLDLLPACRDDRMRLVEYLISGTSRCAVAE